MTVTPLNTRETVLSAYEMASGKSLMERRKRGGHEGGVSGIIRAMQDEEKLSLREMFVLKEQSEWTMPIHDCLPCWISRK
uniref:Uncharacterized protein n=1 Tax=Thermosporothrix sp. COM3 TaxID=2490863 RepID=A0A455SIQ8_9CHLR|nr:hypothetical protein KTC_21910 [Thermosporothrix sp. COM3]